MKVVFLIVAATFLLMITACDPAHTLVIKAPKKGSAVTVYANKNVTGLSGIDLKDEKVVITVPDTADPVNPFKKTFFFGLGNWPDAHVKEYAAHIDSIVFIKAGRREVLTSTEAIYQYLLKNRRGILRTTLNIKAK
jgi:hypothetical protein